MLIRGARAEDVDAIARVRIASWRGAYAGIIPDTFLDPQFIAQFVERRQRTLRNMEREEFSFVAEAVQDGLVGYAVGGPALAPSSVYLGELYEVYVLPHVQKQGLGRQLMFRTACELVARSYPSMRSMSWPRTGMRADFTSGWEERSSKSVCSNWEVKRCATWRTGGGIYGRSLAFRANDYRSFQGKPYLLIGEMCASAGFRSITVLARPFTSGFPCGMLKRRCGAGDADGE
jgi:GNAT superfamily N-acetyltransferase